VLKIRDRLQPVSTCIEQVSVPTGTTGTSMGRKSHVSKFGWVGSSLRDFMTRAIAQSPDSRGGAIVCRRYRE